MKIQLFLPAFLFIALSASGQNSTVTRSLGGFDKIAVSGGFEYVKLKQGSEEGIKIEAEGIDPEKIETSVEKGTLRLKIKNGYYGKMKARVVITFKSIREIANSGSSDIICDDVIKADKFEIASSGSGDVKCSFDVRELSVAISGSSDMELSGTADVQEYAISGSGDINAKSLSGKEAEVAISGSGDVRLNVSGKVRTSVSGSGDVTNNK